MKKVFVHGLMADHLGFSELELNVKTVDEVFRALEANTKKFYKYITDKANQGIKYRVVIDGKDHECDEQLIAGFKDEVHIIPVPEGTKAGARIIAGIVMMTIGLVMIYSGGGAWAGASMFEQGMVMMGASLILGGITELLMPKPRTEDEESSFTFQGVNNTTTQGNAIPLLYGKFKCGSQLTNLGIYSLEFDQDLNGNLFNAPDHAGVLSDWAQESPWMPIQIDEVWTEIADFIGSDGNPPVGLVNLMFPDDVREW